MQMVSRNARIHPLSCLAERICLDPPPPPAGVCHPAGNRGGGDKCCFIQNRCQWIIDLTGNDHFQATHADSIMGKMLSCIIGWNFNRRSRDCSSLDRKNIYDETDIQWRRREALSREQAGTIDWTFSKFIYWGSSSDLPSSYESKGKTWTVIRRTTWFFFPLSFIVLSKGERCCVSLSWFDLIYWLAHFQRRNNTRFNAEGFGNKECPLEREGQPHEIALLNHRKQNRAVTLFNAFKDKWTISQSQGSNPMHSMHSSF